MDKKKKKKIPWTEEPGISPWGCKELDMTEQTHIHTQKNHTHEYIDICMCVYVNFIYYKILDFTFV